MSVIIYIIWSLVWGFVTKTINENKGYEGGFWWGFFLGFIGLIVVICKSDNNSNDSYDNYSENSQLFSMAAQEYSEKQTLTSGGWRCSQCGRVNPSYTGTCCCGMSKSDSEAKTVADANAAYAKKKDEEEINNINKLKAYKDLLDSNAITQEEFDKKKAELLKL